MNNLSNEFEKRDSLEAAEIRLYNNNYINVKSFVNYSFISLLFNTGVQLSYTRLLNWKYLKVCIVCDYPVLLFLWRSKINENMSGFILPFKVQLKYNRIVHLPNMNHYKLVYKYIILQ